MSPVASSSPTVAGAPWPVGWTQEDALRSLLAVSA
jgi:hypothetical protein